MQSHGPFREMNFATVLLAGSQGNINKVILLSWEVYNVICRVRLIMYAARPAVSSRQAL